MTILSKKEMSEEDIKDSLNKAPYCKERTINMEIIDNGYGKTSVKRRKHPVYPAIDP